MPTSLPGQAPAILLALHRSGLASQRRGTVSRFFGFDGQQNAPVLTDSTGAVTDSYVYTAFGEERG